MLPDPLHPAVIHFPIVLTILLPLVALGTFRFIHKGIAPHRVWWASVAVSAALAFSTWAAVETGESQEERIEAVVAEAPLEGHEQSAERFFFLTLGLLGVTFLGLVKGKVGLLARRAALVGALVLPIGAYQVGHSGGALVYRYGAASAYSDVPNTPRPSHEEREHDED